LADRTLPLPLSNITRADERGITSSGDSAQKTVSHAMADKATHAASLHARQRDWLADEELRRQRDASER
jgi:hypothetical protein